MTLLPALARFPNALRRRAGSHARQGVAVGSSRIRMRALRLSARAISTSWRSAMERSSTTVSGPTSLSPSRRQQGLDLAPVVSARAKPAANTPEQDFLEHRSAPERG